MGRGGKGKSPLTREPYAGHRRLRSLAIPSSARETGNRMAILLDAPPQKTAEEPAHTNRHVCRGEAKALYLSWRESRFRSYSIEGGTRMEQKRVPVAAAMAAAALFFAAAAPKADLPQKTASTLPATVAQLDLFRFEGTWYELARIPIPIARDWVNTRDVYIHNADGSWSVRYEGNKGGSGGPRKVLKQRLRIPDPARPGEMEVSFIPFIWMKYRLLHMSGDYRFMLVGSSSMGLLWLMSREPNPSVEEYEGLKAKAASLGYDVAKLERVSQSGD